MRIAKDAFRFLIPLALISLLTILSNFLWTGLFFVVLTIFVGCFFRDPDRKILTDEGLILAPADGKIVAVNENSDGTNKVSIFLSIFNVHINRSPIKGKIEEIIYHPGRFRMAFDNRASIENEQNSIVVKNDLFQVKCVQIAGAVARRIVCWKKIGDQVKIGERIGLIRFGSRVDLVLPVNVSLSVAKGDKVWAGLTPIGRLILEQE